MKVKRNNYNLNYPIKSRRREREREKERDGCYKNIRYERQRDEVIYCVYEDREEKW